jgi:hypothetical protein
MARYYFNFRSAQNTVLGEEGLDLLDVHAVREEALASVREDFANAIKDRLGAPRHLASL